MKDNSISQSIWTLSLVASLVTFVWTLYVTEPDAGPFGITFALVLSVAVLCWSVIMLGVLAACVAVAIERIDRAKNKPQPKHAKRQR
jgi:cell division protein FtsW (lipid II flippase)